MLGFWFGVSDSTASHMHNRPILLREASGNDTMRLPDPGCMQYKERDTLLAEVPVLEVIIDSFLQRVQRCKKQKDADAHVSNTKKQHTRNNQMAIDENDGRVCDVPERVVEPNAGSRSNTRIVVSIPPEYAPWRG